MKTRKTFSVMLVICMLLSLVFPSSGGVSNAASASDKVTVIDVTQYGADPTGVKDSAEGIQAAIGSKRSERTGCVGFPERGISDLPGSCTETGTVYFKYFKP